MDREKEFYRRIREGYSDRYAFVEIMDTIVEELEIEDGKTNDTSTIEEVIRSMVGVEREDEETHDTTSTGVAVAMEVEDEETNDTSTIEEVFPTTGVTVKVMEMEDKETHDTSTMVVSVDEASNHLCPPEEAIPSSGMAVAVEVEDEETKDTSTIEEVVPTTGVTVKDVEVEDECADEEKGALGDGSADSSLQAETVPQKVGKKRAFKSFFARAWKALRRSLCCRCSVAE